mmetsp:Transcript_16137/g.54436  ORF Transcript_16137/g.54436 Transcript_16137/m.54436 type:complete len:239 (-) Transcript_16137:1261-1977(-)
MMVWRRCAMVINVADLNSRETTRCTTASVAASTWAVGSSIQTTRAPRTTTRAMASSCRSPMLKASAGPSFCERSDFERPTLTMAASHSASEYFPKGSTLDRPVPSKITASCGIMATRSLKSPRPILETSTPSISTVPPHGSTSLKSAIMIVDLPAPVRPTTPQRSPPFKTKEHLRRDLESPGRYRRSTCLNSTAPLEGHSWATSWASCGSTCLGASSSRPRPGRYSNNLSKDAADVVA